MPSNFSDTTRRIFYAALFLNLLGFLSYATEVLIPYYDCSLMSSHCFYLILISRFNFLVFASLISILFSSVTLVLLGAGGKWEDNISLFLMSFKIFMAIHLSTMLFDLTWVVLQILGYISSIVFSVITFFI